jgi:hypothetical protein
MSNKTTIKNVIFLGIFALGISFFVKEGCPVYINFLGLLVAGIASIRFI